MKHVLRLALVSLVVLALGGCFLFGPPVLDYAGRGLPVDSDGHFKEDIVYRTGQATYTFYANGIYEWTYEEYDGSRWEVTSGSRYDYSYDPDALTLTRDYTHFYDGSQWQTGSYSRESTVSAFFAEHKFYWFESVMVADPDTDNTFVYTYSETYEGEESNDSMTFSYDPDALTWNMAFNGDYFNDTGTKVYEDEGEASGTFTTFPEGTKLRCGNTVTVRIIQQESRYREWDSVSGWTPWAESTDQSISTEVVTHMGDFLLFDGETSYRGLLRPAE